MIAIPAIDLREGACVQLVGGSYDDERVRIADPMEAARRWANAGFRLLHVVDLDAATGAGDNHSAIESLIDSSGVDVQVGGGVRTTERVDELLGRGANSVTVGTRAVEDIEWLCGLAADRPGKIVVAADVFGRRVLTHGWMRQGDWDVIDFVREISMLPLAGLLVTVVQREGRMAGTDRELMAEVARVSAVPVIASGGIASADELRALDRCGVRAAVLGMALYTGALDPELIAEEFDS